MTINTPLVSIITASYNNIDTIDDAIKSIVNQSYNNIEYIFIDGASTDGTLNKIKEYEPALLKKGINVKIISEKDKGIADAWNKGISLSTGKIIGLLNSDDWYSSNTIEKVVEKINPNLPELSYGICKKVNNEKSIIETLDINFNKFRIYWNFGFSHTTCFATRKVYDKVGLFNLNYKIAIDTDFLLRVIKSNISIIKCSNVTYMRIGGVSYKYNNIANYEYKTALLKNGFNRSLVLFFDSLKTIYKRLKK